MPTNHYKCESCSEEWTYIGPRKNKECPQCNCETKPQLPKDINTPSVFEIVDKEHNVKWRENFQERAQKRNAKGSKHTAKEIAREHCEDPKKHGWTEDDPKLV
jgi:predicted aldo/keto reductase-like oxidoreductase